MKTKLKHSSQSLSTLLPMTRKIRNQNVFEVKSLMDSRRERIRNMHKMSEDELEEQAEGARVMINQFPLIR